jgi:preprotein translocase subunit SecF
MSGTTMVVVIVCVVFGIIYKMFKMHLEFKAKTVNHNKTSDQQTDQLKEQIERLTERVQVLEKIVTDEGYQVQKDINNL